MSAERIHKFYLCLGNSPIAAALLALSFAEGPSYNGFVLAAVRGKTPSTYALIQGVGGWAKDLLVLNSESMVMMRRRVPKGHLFMPFLSLACPTILDIILLCPSAFVGCSRPASTRCFGYPRPSAFVGCFALGPGITFRLSRITHTAKILFAISRTKSPIIKSHFRNDGGSGGEMVSYLVMPSSRRVYLTSYMNGPFPFPLLCATTFSSSEPRDVEKYHSSRSSCPACLLSAIWCSLLGSTTCCFRVGREGRAVYIHENMC